jgi:hypothetical protein
MVERRRLQNPTPSPAVPGTRPPPKNQVYLWGDADKPALLLQAGPDQSEIKFSNGNTRVVSNDWITTQPRKAKPEP